MYKPTQEDRHIYLYSKMWYKVTNLIDDLKILLSYRSKSLPENISVDDILIVLTEIASYHTDFPCFMNQLKEKMRTNESMYKFKSAEEIVIYTLLSILRFTNASRIPFNLGKPCEIILPLKEDTQK